MRGYAQICPLAKAAEVFAQRWTPLILRELFNGSHRFSELRQGMPLVSQTLLVQRLRSLEHAGVIERRRSVDRGASEYHLTPAGEELRPVIEWLAGWGYRWAINRLSPEDLELGSLMWFISREIQVDRLPSRRVVVQFEFPKERKRLYWLVLNRPNVDLCLTDLGFETDLFVTADTEVLASVYLGRIDLREAIQQGLIVVEGNGDLARVFPEWIGITPAARFGRLLIAGKRRAPDAAVRGRQPAF